MVGDDVVDIKFDAELYKNSDRMSISIADDGTYTVTVKGLNSLTVKLFKKHKWQYIKKAYVQYQQ